MRLFIILLFLIPCIAWAVHDKELDNVYKDTLIIPPELRETVVDDEEGSAATAQAQLTPAEEDFLSMFDAAG